ncbi:MAG: CBS domain-containing protein [Thermodesulfobacteriota bacterium]|nr:CBS domain-containing protein [Thermodesulfobacteriota bacterium]
MLTANDIMTRDIVTVLPDTKITEAAKLLLENHINGIPVVESSGKFVGIICQSDLVVQQKRFPLPSFFTLVDSFITIPSPKQIEKEVQKISAITVSRAMAQKPVTVRPDTGIDTLAELMVDKGFHTIPVLDGEKLVGIVGKEDILRTLMSEVKSKE